MALSHSSLASSYTSPGNSYSLSGPCPFDVFRLKRIVVYRRPSLSTSWVIALLLLTTGALWGSSSWSRWCLRYSCLVGSSACLYWGQCRKLSYYSGYTIRLTTTGVGISKHLGKLIGVELLGKELSSSFVSRELTKLKLSMVLVFWWVLTCLSKIKM